MWQLAGVLNSLKQNLPLDFDRRNGIRSLFPADKNGFSITLLDNYVYTRTGRVVEDDVAVDFDVYADGAGRWRYRAIISCENASYSGNYAVGFAFAWSQDGTAHGHMHIGTCDLIDDRGASIRDDLRIALAVTVQGADDWIIQHWPDIFALNIKCRVQTTTGPEVGLYASGTTLANHLGFPTMTLLTGASAHEEDVTTGAGGTTQPGKDFPGEINWGFGWELPPP